MGIFLSHLASLSFIVPVMMRTYFSASCPIVVCHKGTLLSKASNTVTLNLHPGWLGNMGFYITGANFNISCIGYPETLSIPGSAAEVTLHQAENGEFCLPVQAVLELNQLS